jgi:hypothetical protein
MVRGWGAGLGITFLRAELLGRIYLVWAGLYTLSGIDESSLFTGSIIAVLFILYIGFSWNKFSQVTVAKTMATAAHWGRGQPQNRLSNWIP